MGPCLHKWRYQPGRTDLIAQGLMKTLKTRLNAVRNPTTSREGMAVGRVDPGREVESDVSLLVPGRRGIGTFRSTPGRAAPGPPGLPSGNGCVQELDPQRFEFAAAEFVPLRVDPHS
jgi:hypothetical protein